MAGILDTLTNLFSDKGSDSAKMLALLGTGLMSLIENNKYQPPPNVQPLYKPAPFYDRALSAPMRQYGSLGEKLYFNPNPFQLNPQEAAQRYGPSKQEYLDSVNAYQQGLAALQAAAPTRPINTMQTPGKLYAAQQDTAPSVLQMLKGVRQYNQGGPVVGPGDGASDSVPAMVNGGQPAALSDGEYVLPASFVSAVGNGSTRAGVAQIQRMVDRVMGAKYGTTEATPRPIDPRRALL